MVFEAADGAVAAGLCGDGGAVGAELSVGGGFRFQPLWPLLRSRLFSWERVLRDQHRSRQGVRGGPRERRFAAGATGGAWVQLHSRAARADLGRTAALVRLAARGSRVLGAAAARPAPVG